MSDALIDAFTRIARHEARARATAGIGRVVDVLTASKGSPVADHAVAVEMRDTGLVLPAVPVAVGALGFAAIPAVDDLVLVVFADGDDNAPVVTGRLYHSDLNPPEHDSDQLVLRLPAGQAQGDLNLVVDGAAPTIHLDLPGDVQIDIAEERITLLVGKLNLKLEGGGGGRAEIAAGGSTIVLKQDGDITISAQGKLQLEGVEVAIKGQSKVTVAGALVELN